MRLLKIKNNIFSSIFKKWQLYLLIQSIIGLQSDGDSSIQVDDTIRGFWSVPEKGWIFEFTEVNDIFYNIIATSK